MNRHGGPNSSGRPVDPGHLYAALMPEAGGGPHPAGAFVPGGNAFSLAHYQNMPNDQVDWAALAQQWIKMRETWIQPMPALIPSPPPPPSFDRDESEGRTERQQQHHHHRLPELDRTYEEQGEAPMEVEREEEDDGGEMPVPPQPPSISGGWTAPDDASGWPAPAASPWTGTPSTGPVVPPSAHLPGPPTIVNESASAAVALWQAKNSHLFTQMAHQGKDAVGPVGRAAMAAAAVPAATRRSFSAQPTKPAAGRLPGLMDREIKMGGAPSASASSCSSAAVPEGQQRQQEKDGFGTAASINEEKRMMLPAWIREGLEKMEREKQAKLKREQERRLYAEKVESQQSRFSLSPPPPREEQSAPAEQQNQLSHRHTQPEPDEAPPKNRETVELREEDVEKMTKKILTEIFMETTNEVLMGIAREELNKVQKRKAKQAVTVTTNVGLAAAAGGLGLGIYCDSDEDEEEEEEDEPGDGRNKKASDADNVSGNGTDQNSSDDDASDSEAMRRMMEKIRIRQQDFKATAARIEKWLEDVSECSLNTTAELQRSVTAGGSDDGSEDGGEGGPDRGADGLDSDRESPAPRVGGTASAGNNGFGNFGRPLQPYGGGTGGGSQENAGRKRRDKRVSRFSDPRDTVRTTHITHVSILSAAASAIAAPLPKLDELMASGPGAVTVSPTAITTAAAAGAAAAATAPNTITPTVANAARSKSSKSSVPNRLTAAQRSFNSYFNIPPGQTYQTIYSIGGGTTTQLSKGKPDPADQQQHQQAATSRECDERDSNHHRRKRHHRDRSHTRSSHSSRTSYASRSRSPDSRGSSRSRSPDHQRSRRSRSGTRHSSSSHRYHRYERNRSSSRGRSRSPGTRHRHRKRTKRSRTRSRSRSSSKYSSRRRF